MKTFMGNPCSHCGRPRPPRSVFCGSCDRLICEEVVTRRPDLPVTDKARVAEMEDENAYIREIERAREAEAVRLDHEYTNHGAYIS